MKWRIGDFGRFTAESPKLPRFEVLRAERAGVTVQYSGTPNTTVIPPTTFKRDCVNWWDVTGIDLDEPAWLQRGVLFSFTHGYDTVLTSHSKFRFMVTSQSFDIRGAVLRYRHRRSDYISCEVFNEKGEPNVLLLVPLKKVVDFGYQVMTKWDRIAGQEILEDDDEVIDFTGLL